MPLIFILFMQDILLLHGAIGAADHFDKLVSELEQDYKVHVFNFPGHGGAVMPAQPFSIPVFAGALLAYMDEKGLDKPVLFGYSMGGYVAMYLAKHHPGRVGKLLTLATKYHWDETIAAKEIQMLDADKIAAKVPAFADALQKRHAPADWKILLQHTAEMLKGLGKQNVLQAADYADIQTPALIMLGDRDKMVSLEETVQVYKSLPNAQLCVLPATPHPIEQVNMKQLAVQIRQFVL